MEKKRSQEKSGRTFSSGSRRLSQKLLERLIEITTDEGDYVYDPMCGSGTTAEAAKKLNRICILNDINTDIIEIVKSRFNKA